MGRKKHKLVKSAPYAHLKIIIEHYSLILSVTKIQIVEIVVEKDRREN